MSAKACLPSTGGSCKTGKSDITPGWSDYVKPYCEDSKFWYSTWLSAGKPDQGPLHETMKKSKCQYKYAVRRLKRANESIQNDKFVSGVVGALIFSQRSRNLEARLRIVAAELMNM